MISSLATVTKLSPNHSGKRTHAVDTITPHCFVGQVSAERGLEVFLPKDREASCNYVIGYDGKIGCSVDEDNRSWCSSSKENDQRAITIECASDAYHPWAFTPACYDALIKLSVDICKRYNKKKLVWIADKHTALNYTPKADEMRLTVHRWFANKACPGDWMMNKMQAFADAVTKQLGDVKPEPTPKPTPTDKLYHVQVGAYKVKKNAINMENKLKADGFSTYITVVNGLYKVQTGAYKSKKNADAQVAKLKAKCYPTYVALY